MTIDTEATERFMYDPVFHARVTLVKQMFISMNCPEDRLVENVFCASIALHMLDKGLLDIQTLMTEDELKEMHLDLVLNYGVPNERQIRSMAAMWKEEPGQTGTK